MRDVLDCPALTGSLLSIDDGAKEGGSSQSSVRSAFIS